MTDDLLTDPKHVVYCVRTYDQRRRPTNRQWSVIVELHDGRRAVGHGETRLAADVVACEVLAAQKQAREPVFG